MEPKKDEVGVRLDDGLQERVGAYAAREGLTLGEAISALLYLGLEFAERQRTGLKEDIEDLQRELPRPPADGRRHRPRGSRRRSASSPTGPRRPVGSGCPRTSCSPRAGSSRTRSGRGSSPSAGCSRPAHSRGSWRDRWTAFRSGASAPTTWPSAGSRSWRAAGSTRPGTSCSSRSAPASWRRARTWPASPTSSGRTRSTHRTATSRAWPCVWSLSSRTGSPALSLAPSRPGSRKRRGTRSCASSRARRACTWPASSRRREESLEPVAHVHLSCRQSDGGPAPALARDG